MKTARVVSLGLALAFLMSLQWTAMAQEKGYSHIRIVRLSFVNGTVLVKRPAATEWAKASVNTPIEQGFTVSTSTNSFAETQFENGSTARLGQLSKLDFAELALAPDGAKVNHLTFEQGYATFNFEPKHGDVYSVQAANATITPNGKSEFRVDVEPAALRVEVFDGSVKVADDGHKVSVKKGKVLKVNLDGELALNSTRGIGKDAWDNWVHERDQQTDLALNDSAVAMNSPVSGWSDLDEYGEWGYFPGFGYGWSPFAPMGWTPFSMGQWSWYPTFGYTWISSEPWGWLPFHYGFWNYSPSFGYFWMPGGGFNTFYPGLVTWFQGPGYVGWAPMGAGGVPVCRMRSCITTTTTAAFSGGRIVRSVARPPVNVRLTPVQSINVAPGAMARLSGVPVTQEASTHAAFSRFSAMRSTRTPAPTVLLMGQTPAQSAAEMRTLAAHHSIFDRAFAGNGAQAIHARLGNTIGGRYILNRNGAMRSIQPMNRASFSQRPTFLQHRSASGFSAAAPRMQRNGQIREAGGMNRGFSGSPASMRASSPAMSSAPAMSAAHSAPAASGGSRH